MTIKSSKKRATGLLAASALLAAGTLGPVVTSSHAADPYDAKLEKRVEALERELNLMSGDSKGKDTQTYEVPTFMRALGKQVQELTIQGELRFRYQFDNRDPEGFAAGTTNAFRKGNPGEIPQSRYRFRLRMALNYKFSDNWFAGVAIQTQAGSDNTHQTFTEGFDNFSIYLHAVYLGWKVNDNLTLLFGKVLAPFYNNTDRIVDFGDIRPGGLTERFNFDITPQFNLKINLGQYPFMDNPENGLTASAVGTATAGTGPYAGTTFIRTLGGNRTFLTGPNGSSGRDNDASWDAVLLYQDIVLTYKPTNKTSIILAPAFYFYPNNGSVGLTSTTNTAAGTAVTQRSGSAANDQSYSGTLESVAPFNDADATRNLFVGMLGGEVNFPIPFGGKDINMKFFGDFAYNFAGGARDYKEYGLAEDKFIDKTTVVAGFLLGGLKAKGDWYITGDYGYTGMGSIDPNINDPNFGMSRLNQQGFRAAMGYNFYSWLKGEVVYYNTWNLEKNLHNVVDPDRGFFGGRALLRNAVGTETSPRIPFADTNAEQIVQVQLTASF